MFNDTSCWASTPLVTSVTESLVTSDVNVFISRIIALVLDENTIGSMRLLDDDEYIQNIITDVSARVNKVLVSVQLVFAAMKVLWHSFYPYGRRLSESETAEM